MSVEASLIVSAMAIGIGATLVMDLWNLFLKRTFGLASLDYCLLGRWLRHMPDGTVRHASIAAAPQKSHECTLGWIAHYTIGVVFALVFVILASPGWLARPTLLLPLLYGIGTVVFPFFIMQPSLGLGIAASRTPKPMQARLKSLATHTVFGAGLYLSALGSTALASDSDVSRGHSLDGRIMGDLRVHDFHSRVFDNTRKLRVLVPEGYDAPENRSRRYPVLYLNDGQNLFDSTTSILNPMEWRVDETVHALVAAGRIHPLLVVGIDNAGRVGRFREYFPYVDQYLSPPEPDPQGKRYPDFLVDEVLPFVESRYRVVRDSTARGIGGSSAGALAALVAVITRPGVFGRLLIESPSIYVDDALILRDAASTVVWPERIFLGVGTNEDGTPSCDPKHTQEQELVRDVRRFERLLRDARVDSRRIHMIIAACAVHNESAWAARLPAALEFLYSTRR